MPFYRLVLTGYMLSAVYAWMWVVVLGNMKRTRSATGIFIVFLLFTEFSSGMRVRLFLVAPAYHRACEAVFLMFFILQAGECGFVFLPAAAAGREFRAYSRRASTAAAAPTCKAQAAAPKRKKCRVSRRRK